MAMIKQHMLHTLNTILGCQVALAFHKVPSNVSGKFQLQVASVAQKSMLVSKMEIILIIPCMCH